MKLWESILVSAISNCLTIIGCITANIRDVFRCGYEYNEIPAFLNVEKYPCIHNCKFCIVYQHSTCAKRAILFSELSLQTFDDLYWTQKDSWTKTLIFVKNVYKSRHSAFLAPAILRFINSLNSNNKKSAFSFVHQLTTWHCLHLLPSVICLLRCHCCGTQQETHCCSGQMMEQTDGRTPDSFMDCARHTCEQHKHK